MNQAVCSIQDGVILKESILNIIGITLLSLLLILIVGVLSIVIYSGYHIPLLILLGFVVIVLLIIVDITGLILDYRGVPERWYKRRVGAVDLEELFQSGRSHEIFLYKATAVRKDGKNIIVEDNRFAYYKFLFKEITSILVILIATSMTGVVTKAYELVSQFSVDRFLTFFFTYMIIPVFFISQLLQGIWYRRVDRSVEFNVDEQEIHIRMKAAHTKNANKRTDVMIQLSKIFDAKVIEDKVGRTTVYSLKLHRDEFEGEPEVIKSIAKKNTEDMFPIILSPEMDFLRSFRKLLFEYLEDYVEIEKEPEIIE